MTKEEFYGNLKLLKAGEDDFEIGISNIKNSTTNIDFLLLFQKSLSLHRRHRLTEKFDELNDIGTWDEVVPKLKDEVAREIAQELVTKEVTSLLNNHWNFINKINLEISW